MQQVERSFPDQLLKPVTWSDEEKEVLLRDGAVVYLPIGETISRQIQLESPFCYVAHGFVIDGKNRLTDLPSRPIEVAIYPDPKRFFVESTFDESKVWQEVRLREDCDELRKRIGLENLDEILPEASEVTELAFRHFRETQGRLFGKDYSYRWMRTNTPIDKWGSLFAGVGNWREVDGLLINDWPGIGSHYGLGAARWLVPNINR